MKTLYTLCLLLICSAFFSCSSNRPTSRLSFSPDPSGFPTYPFEFIGVPEKVSEDTFLTPFGKMRSITIRIIEVTKRKDVLTLFDKDKDEVKEINLPFRDGMKPPVEIGQTYLFEALYASHGIVYTKIEPIKNPLTKP